MESFEAGLPGSLPTDVRELLSYASGFRFDRLKTDVDFLGSELFAFEEALPHGVPLLGDGFGNCWVLDVHPSDGRWGQVFYVCHDPLMVLVQAPSLAALLTQIFDAARGQPDLLEVVRDARTVSRGEGRIDLNEAPIGAGFMFDLNDDVLRVSDDAVFEIRRTPRAPGIVERLHRWWTGRV